MVFRNAVAVAVGVVFCTAVAFAERDGGLLRIYDGSQPPPDTRLKPRNLDNTAPFIPQQHIHDKAAWE